jgi:hypothetical protein
MAYVEDKFHSEISLEHHWIWFTYFEVECLEEDLRFPLSNLCRTIPLVDVIS